MTDAAEPSGLRPLPLRLPAAPMMLKSEVDEVNILAAETPLYKADSLVLLTHVAAAAAASASSAA